MRTLTPSIVASVIVFASVFTGSRPAHAQNWSFDAREIALGGIGTMSNVAADMVDEQRPYRAIVLPFGLIQVIPNWPKMNPTSDEFDLVRAMEYAASPLHFIFGRDSSDTGGDFLTDIRNGTLSHDLNTYRGFVPANEVTAEGLASPSWGGTIKFKKNANNGSFQGIYIGAGPYFSMQTAASIDPALTALLESPTPVYIPNTSFYMSNDTTGQVALAVTGGYRARIAWPGSDSDFEGMYIGVNLHTLFGFEYENFLPEARLDTDATGMLTVNLAKGVPVQIVRNHSSSGRGFALDVGGSAVTEHWQVGLGVNGIGNHITWKDVERTDFVLDSLFNGGEFQDFPTIPVDDVKVELPVDVRGNASYFDEAWTATTEVGHGYSGTIFRGGVERRFSRSQLRGGTRYIKEKWEPTFGAGYDFTEGFGMDVALFGTSANIERERHWAIAFSFRFMQKQNP